MVFVRKAPEKAVTELYTIASQFGKNKVSFYVPISFLKGIAEKFGLKVEDFMRIAGCVAVDGLYAKCTIIDVKDDEVIVNPYSKLVYELFISTLRGYM